MYNYVLAIIVLISHLLIGNDYLSCILCYLTLNNTVSTNQSKKYCLNYLLVYLVYLLVAVFHTTAH